MNDDTQLKKKISRLGNVLLIISCLGLLGGLIFVPAMVWISSPTGIEATEWYDDQLYPDVITLETTVGEIIEMDRSYAEAHRNSFILSVICSGAFYLGHALIFLRLALAWRRAESFARPTITGLRWLGLVHIVQFIVAHPFGFFHPWADHSVYLVADFYAESSVFSGTGPLLSSGILFLILSWVLDYGRRLSEEQSLTI